MKKNILIFILFLQIVCLHSCNSKAADKPDNLIDKQKMELIMQDIMIMKTISRNYDPFVKNRNWFGDRYIYEKYKIDCLELINSEKYYSKSPKIYFEMHNNIKNKMEKLIDSIDVLAKNQAKKIKEIQLKNKDSLISSN